MSRTLHSDRQRTTFSPVQSLASCVFMWSFHISKRHRHTFTPGPNTGHVEFQVSTAERGQTRVSRVRGCAGVLSRCVCVKVCVVLSEM